MDKIELAQKIEALLFAEGDPMSHGTLCGLLDVSKRELEGGIKTLKELLKGHGIMVTEKENEVSLSTVPSTSAVVAQMRKNELEKPLGKAGLETIAIVMYRGPMVKSEIDYIRGVDSGGILRSLMIRGLIERNTKSDTRGYVYSATIDALRYLGLAHTEELPEYRDVDRAITQKLERV